MILGTAVAAFMVHARMIENEEDGGGIDCGIKCSLSLPSSITCTNK